MKNFLFAPFLMILLMIGGCSGDHCECQSTGRKANCYCTHEYDPVCGCDGQTYSNACNAECEGIPEWDDGPCNDPTR